MTTLNLPSKMDFTMGSTEQKMDMTLDDIIKQTRKSKAQRVPIKGNFKNSNTAAKRAGKNQAARAALQRSVAARSSNLRQGKFAEARARNGAGTFVATQAAGRRAFATPVTGRNRVWMPRSDLRRNNITGQRLVPGLKRNSMNAPGNMKISVINNGSKAGGQRFTAQPFRKRNVPNNPSRQVLTGQQLNADRMDVDYVQQPQTLKPKGRTLDSLFAEIKERRVTQPVVVQPFTSVGTGRRGGRGGFGGRRRQGQ